MDWGANGAECGDEWWVGWRVERGVGANGGLGASGAGCGGEWWVEGLVSGRKIIFVHVSEEIMPL